MYGTWVTYLFLNVAEDSSQPSYDVQYEVPATEGESSRLLF